MNFTPINPIKALFWSAVINGIVAVPVMAVMMVMSTKHAIMGRFTVHGPLRFFGWLATAAMAAAAVAMGIGLDRPRLTLKSPLVLAKRPTRASPAFRQAKDPA